MGLAAGAFAQGTVFFDNGTPTSTSSTATSGGAFFIQTGANVALFNDASGTYYGTLMGGASAGSLTTLVSDTLLDYAASGELSDDTGNSYTVTGVAGGATGYFELFAWEGNYASYAAARAAGAHAADSGIFTSVTGGAGTPPGLAANLTGMPAVILTGPEPGTFALAGLGAAALLIFRRRK